MPQHYDHRLTILNESSVQNNALRWAYYNSHENNVLWWIDYESHLTENFTHWDSSVEDNALWWTEHESHSTGNFTHWDSSVENNEPSMADYYTNDFGYHTAFYVATLILDALFAVIGTLINAWFLSAMLKSPEIRIRMRNKILCAMLAVNLTVSAITLPMYLIRDISFQNGFWHWFVYEASIALGHIQVFAGNWYMFILVCFYTSQVVNFEPRFAPLWMKIFTAVFIISPIVVGLLFVPLTMNGYFDKSDCSCGEITFKALKVYASVNTIVPQSLAILLLVVTAVLKYTRHPYRRLCDTSCDQLIDDGSPIDPLYPFVALLVGAMVTDLCRAISLLNFKFLMRLGPKIWLPMVFGFRVLSYLRLILVPMILLLFPDIRERIKTWRPCRRSAPSPVDLVVTYEKTAA